MFSFIYFRSTLVPKLRVTGGQLESLPAVIERRQGDSLDESPVGVFKLIYIALICTWIREILSDFLVAWGPRTIKPIC